VFGETLDIGIGNALDKFARGSKYHIIFVILEGWMVFILKLYSSILITPSCMSIISPTWILLSNSHNTFTRSPIVIFFPLESNIINSSTKINVSSKTIIAESTGFF